jgi:CheY-like chemotaxis protein
LYVAGVHFQSAADDPHADIAAALHDVSNALTIILGWVADARTHAAIPPPVAQALELIEDQARIARGLARGAIGARPEAGDAEEPLLLDGVVGGAVAALALEASQAGVTVKVARSDDSSPSLTRVPRAGDVRQIVTNLVMNALAFSPRGGHVEVRLESHGGMTSIVVEDDGPGVPEERSEAIFAGSSTRDGGAGIGLRHSLSLARAAGGDLELVGPREGSGASFRLTWPRTRAPSIMPPAARSTPVLDGRRVLVVEDDEHVTMLLEAALGARGALVTVARNRAELAVALAAGEHDTALIDLSPIAADVQGAVDALRHRSPHAALVFISGSSIGLPDALAAEGVVWVRKPFEVSEIVKAVLGAGGARE